MALHKVTIYKRLNTSESPKWTNVYWIEALGFNTALDAGQGIADIEKTILTDLGVIYRITAQLATGGTIASRVVNIGGLRAIAEDVLLPLFNTVRVILSDDLGRPESKYLRAALGEADVVGFSIGTDTVIDLYANYVTPLLAVLGLRGPNGEAISSGIVQLPVQMRQRSWHRRTRPGFKRGYVPV